MLRSDLCDYSDAYIVVKGIINLKASENTDLGQKDVAFKNNAPIRSCITKINSALIDDTEGLSIVTPMYNLLEYSQNYSVASEKLWNYYRDKVDDVDDSASNRKSFKYKTKIVGKTIPPLNTEDAVPLKYLRYFWRSFDLPLINCEIELELKWTENCVLIEKDDNITGVSSTITTTKLYVPVVSLSINDNKKFLENIKRGFKITISWNRYRCEITTQPKSKNIDYLIDLNV